MDETLWIDLVLFLFVALSMSMLFLPCFYCIVSVKHTPKKKFISKYNTQKKIPWRKVCWKVSYSVEFLKGLKYGNDNILFVYEKEKDANDHKQQQQQKHKRA